MRLSNKSWEWVPYKHSVYCVYDPKEFVLSVSYSVCVCVCVWCWLRLSQELRAIIDRNLSETFNRVTHCEVDEEIKLN